MLALNLHLTNGYQSYIYFSAIPQFWLLCYNSQCYSLTKSVYRLVYKTFFATADRRMPTLLASYGYKLLTFLVLLT